MSRLTALLQAEANGIVKTMFSNYRYVRIGEKQTINSARLQCLPSLSFGGPTISVNTHIYRVSNRTKLAIGKNVVQVEQKLLKVVLAEFKVDVHHWLILHGRYTCIARNPRCGSCIIEDLRVFKDKTD